jgi:hypothetical protein
MPYIREEDKTHARYSPMNVGELTYAIQQTIAEYLLYNGLSYQRIAEVTGALSQAQRDFDERVVQPYEAKKREENGDVWPMSLIG